MRVLSPPGPAGAAIKNSLISAVGSVLFSRSSCGSLMSSIEMIETSACNTKVTDAPSSVVFFAFGLEGGSSSRMISGSVSESVGIVKEFRGRLVTQLGGPRRHEGGCAAGATSSGKWRVCFGVLITT